MSNGDALLEVLRQAGVRVPQTGNVSCPFHTDADPSLSIERTTGKWHCFSCGKGGGPAQMAQYLQEKGEQVTVPTIPTADSLSYQRPERPTPSVKPVPVSRVEALETILRHAEKRYEESPQAKEYVASRGLTEASRAMFRLGVGGPDAGALEGMLLIPYLGPNGRPVQIRGRCFECGTGSCVGHPKYRGMAGDTTKLFNSRVIKLNPSSPELHIAEGEVDVMSLTQCGLMAVGIPGVNNLKRHHLTLISGFDTVYVWADNDAPGEGLANAVLEAVPWAHRVHIPDGDVNTTLMRRGEDGVRERIGR